MPPWAVLMSVVKPEIAPLPPPGTSQTDGGVPGLQFSATISFAGAAQASTATDGVLCTSAPTAKTAARLPGSRKRRRMRLSAAAARGA